MFLNIFLTYFRTCASYDIKFQTKDGLVLKKNFWLDLRHLLLGRMLVFFFEPEKKTTVNVKIKVIHLKNISD